MDLPSKFTPLGESKALVEIGKNQRSERKQRREESDVGISMVLN